MCIKVCNLWMISRSSYAIHHLADHDSQQNHTNRLNMSEIVNLYLSNHKILSIHYYSTYSYKFDRIDKFRSVNRWAYKLTAIYAFLFLHIIAISIRIVQVKVYITCQDTHVADGLFWSEYSIPVSRTTPDRLWCNT